MLPWLIGAAVVGVGAAIVSAIKDSSSDSSSSSSDYDDRVEEAKKREHQAAIDNSQRLIDQKFSALKSKWQIKNQFKNTLVSSKHNTKVSKSGKDKLISSDLITKHEKAMNKLTNNIQELNSMLDQITGELSAAGISLSHTAIQYQSATPSLTNTKETKAKSKTTDNTKAAATKATAAKDAAAASKTAETAMVQSRAKAKAAATKDAAKAAARKTAETVKVQSRAKAKAAATKDAAKDAARKAAETAMVQSRATAKAAARKAAAKAAATKDNVEVKPKRNRRTKAQIEADMATKDASFETNSKSVAKKATAKRSRV